jgi:hypothetical protein
MLRKRNIRAYQPRAPEAHGDTAQVALRPEEE